MPNIFTHIPRLALLDRVGTVNNESALDYGIETYTLNIDLVANPANDNFSLNLELPAGGVILTLVMLTNTIPNVEGGANALSIVYVKEGDAPTLGNTMASARFPAEDSIDVFTVGDLILTTDPIPEKATLFFSTSNIVTANVDVFFQILATELVEPFIQT